LKWLPKSQQERRDCKGNIVQDEVCSLWEGNAPFLFSAAGGAMSIFVFDKPDNAQEALTSLLATLAGMIDLPQIFVLIKVVDEPREQIVSWRFVKNLKAFLAQAFTFGRPDSADTAEVLRNALDVIDDDVPLLGVLVKYKNSQIVNWRFLEAYRSTLLASILPEDKEN